MIDFVEIILMCLFTGIIGSAFLFTGLDLEELIDEEP